MDAGEQMPSRVFTITAAAYRFGLSPHTLRAWVVAGKLPHIRIGRRLMISEVDLRDFLERHRVPAQHIRDLQGAATGMP